MEMRTILIASILVSICPMTATTAPWEGTLDELEVRWSEEAFLSNPTDCAGWVRRTAELFPTDATAVPILIDGLCHEATGVSLAWAKRVIKDPVYSDFERHYASAIFARLHPDLLISAQIPSASLERLPPLEEAILRWELHSPTLLIGGESRLSSQLATSLESFIRNATMEQRVPIGWSQERQILFLKALHEPLTEDELNLMSGWVSQVPLEQTTNQEFSLRKALYHQTGDSKWISPFLQLSFGTKGLYPRAIGVLGAAIKDSTAGKLLISEARKFESDVAAEKNLRNEAAERAQDSYRNEIINALTRHRSKEVTDFLVTLLNRPNVYQKFPTINRIIQAILDSKDKEGRRAVEDFNNYVYNMAITISQQMWRDELRRYPEDRRIELYKDILEARGIGVDIKKDQP